MTARSGNEPDSRSGTGRWLALPRRRLARTMRRLRGEARITPAAGGAIDVPPLQPARPPGWSTGPPDFIGVGVQRCGTTRWFDLIGSHPEVLRPAGAKELHYFDRFYAGGCTPAELDRYHSYFPREEGRKTGEWTPLYMTAPWIPPLLAAAAPDARLLVLLRDPVERYLSGLQLDVARAARRGSPLSRYAPFEQLTRGFYHAQLTSLLRHFERSQVLVLQYERCTREPQEQLRRTFAFLGLRDVEFAPELDAHPERQPQKPTLDTATRRAYADTYHDDVVRLIEEFPDLDVSLWPNFTDLSS